MLWNISWTSPLIDASFEIGIMLTWAFILWFLFAWILKPQKIFVVLDALPLEEYKKNNNSSLITQKSPPRVKNTSTEISHDTKPENDNIWLIYGITPKVQKLLSSVGIESFQAIIDADVEGLEKILQEGWVSYKRYNPATWPDQARLALDSHWRELEEYQAILQKKK